MPFLKIQSFKLQFLIIVIILLIVPVLVMLYDVYFASRTDDILVANLEKKLTGITDLMSEKIYDHIRQEPGGKQLASLEEIFNSTAKPMTQSYPGVRLCLYVRDTDKIIINGYLHEFGTRLPEEQKQRQRRIYNEAKAGISAVIAGGEPITRLGKTWDDQFLERLVPIKINSEVVAVAWAEERMHPIFSQSARIRLLIRYATLIAFSFGVIASLMTILSLVRQVRQVKNGLLQLKTDFNYRFYEMPGEMGEITRAINTMAAGLAEREQLIEQLRRSENLIALGKLIANIAHELRNPVSIIQATTQVMEPKLENFPELKEYVVRIEEQAERQNKLVEELLDFGRPNPGIIEPINLNELMSEILKDCGLLLQQREIAVDFAPFEEPLVIQGNQEKLKQVFINLILNAVQAMLKGGTLTVRTYAGNSTAYVLVRDTGIGIPEENLSQIFEPFYTRKTGGGGLGLAISQRIVQIHGGSISVESRPDTGTTFTVCLPLIKNEEPDEELT